MSADPRRRYRRNDDFNEHPLQPINASVGAARSAGLLGYHSFERATDGTILSGMSPEGQRVPFVGGMSPEEAATQRARTQATGGSATPTTATPTSNADATPPPANQWRPAPGEDGSGSNTRRSPMWPGFHAPAMVLAGIPEDARDAVLTATRANGVRGERVARPLYDPANHDAPATAPASTARADANGFTPAATGIAALSRSAQEAANRASTGPAVNRPAYGKVGEAIPDAPAVRTDLLGTNVLPNGRTRVNGQPELGSVTVGQVDPNGPADGGTGIFKNGVPQTVDAKGKYVADFGRPTFNGFGREPAPAVAPAPADNPPLLTTAGGIYTGFGGGTNPGAGTSLPKGPLTPEDTKTAYVPPAGPPEVSGADGSLVRGINQFMEANPIAAARMNRPAPAPGSPVAAAPPVATASTPATPRLRSADYSGPALASTAPAGTPAASPIRVEQDPGNRNSFLGAPDFGAQRVAPASLGTVNTPGTIAAPAPAEPLTRPAASRINTPLFMGFGPMEQVSPVSPVAAPALALNPAEDLRRKNLAKVGSGFGSGF